MLSINISTYKTLSFPTVRPFNLQCFQQLMTVQIIWKIFHSCYKIRYSTARRVDYKFASRISTPKKLIQVSPEKLSRTSGFPTRIYLEYFALHSWSWNGSDTLLLFRRKHVRGFLSVCQEGFIQCKYANFVFAVCICRCCSMYA